MTPADELGHRVRVAARALGRAGLSHAYGHCSSRVDGEQFLVSPPRPMILVTDDEPAMAVTINGPLPVGTLGEVRIHQQIYRLRRDVGGVARFQSPNLITLSALGRTPRAFHGLGSYFAPQPPIWNDPRLVRDEEAARRVAEALGEARAIVLRGNGAVTVGRSIEEATVLAWYLEDAARVELGILATGLAAREYTAAEATDRAIATGRLFERMWEWLVASDPAVKPP